MVGHEVMIERAAEPAGSWRDPEVDARLLHMLFDQLPALIAYWDKDLRNVIANEAYVEWFGFTPEQMRGIHIREVLGEKVYALNLPHIRAALDGVEQLFDRTLVDQLGRTRHTQASYVPDVVDGEVRGFFVLVTDVTPRVEAQRLMNEAQSIARFGSWNFVPSTGEVTWSDELFRIFGVDPETFVPRVDDLMSRVHEDDRPMREQVLAEAMESGEPYEAQYRIRRTDGEIREVESRGLPVRDDKGAVVRITGTLRDVTEANQAAREMARINAELVQVNRLNADVISMLGHDVRGPLTVILGHLDELDYAWDASSEERKRARISAVLRSAERLRHLVDDILTLATVDAGTIVPRSTEVDLTGIVREALEEVPDGGAFRVEAGGGAVALVDTFHARQILTNLAANALKYGAAPYSVELTVQPTTVEVAVCDAGVGVPEEFVPRLFERFAAAGSPAVGRSTGFGLYMAARLAEANAGTLRYEPGPEGRGSRFTLTLPRGCSASD